jgi:superfamily II DNA/RNA helicase
VILVPTRDLARQVLSVIKDFSHHLKLSSCGVLGGEDFAKQKKRLQGINDIVVASPGRLRQHKEKGNVYLSRVKHVVIDEVDTMLTQGFGEDLQQVIQAVYSTPEKRSVVFLACSCTISILARSL